MTLTNIALLVACFALGGVAGMAAGRLIRRHRGTPVTQKSAEMERLSRRVTRIHTPDLASHLETATVAAFESVHQWTRAVNPLEREALQAEAITAVRAQLALLEEQKRRGIS